MRNKECFVRNMYALISASSGKYLKHLQQKPFLFFYSTISFIVLVHNLQQTFSFTFKHMYIFLVVFVFCSFQYKYVTLLTSFVISFFIDQ